MNVAGFFPPLYPPPPNYSHPFFFVHDLITSWWLKLFCSVNRPRRRLTCWTKMRWSLDCYRYQHWLQLQSSPHAPSNLFVLQVASFFKPPEERSGISDVQHTLSGISGLSFDSLSYLFFSSFYAVLSLSHNVSANGDSPAFFFFLKILRHFSLEVTLLCVWLLLNS